MSTRQQDIELLDYRDAVVEASGVTSWNTPSSTDIEQAPLPPSDTGKAAWLVLAGCTLIQTPVWGN
jgi:hypothetical protein